MGKRRPGGEEKPEGVTHLNKEELVFKLDPRIGFRGSLDSLQAEVLIFQNFVKKRECFGLASALGEILNWTREILGSDVTGRPVKERRILNLDYRQMRERSHHPGRYYGVDHFLPSEDMGEVLLGLNKLRTLVRQTELAAYRAYGTEEKNSPRAGVLEGLNRMSSFFYILMILVRTGGEEADCEH